MHGRRIDIVLIQETKAPYTYEHKNSRCTRHIIGTTYGSHTARGVAVVYRNGLRNYVDSILPVNERLMLVKVKAARDLVLINNYSHTADGHDLMEKEGRYEKLKELISRQGNSRVVTRLRCRRAGDEELIEEHMFADRAGRIQHCSEGVIENRQLFLDFAKESKQSVANTWFK